MDKKSVAYLVGEVTRQASFGNSGLVTRAQFRRASDVLATKMATQVAERLNPSSEQHELTPYQRAEYLKMCAENEQRVTQRRQLEINEYYELCELGRPPATNAKAINEKWLEELDKRNAATKKLCFALQPPKRPSFLKRLFHL